MSTRLDKKGKRYRKNATTPTRRTQAKRSEDMRARLSQAAYEVIASHGHSAFRTAMVAIQAGVSQGALLHHFPSKDALTLAAVDRALDVAGAAAMKRIMRKTTAVETTLTSMLEDFRDFFSSDSFWVALDITMDASKNIAIAPAIRRIVAIHRAPVYAQWAAKLSALGWSQPRSEETVRMTAAIVSGLGIRTLWADDAHDDESYRRWIKFIVQANKDL
jgi:AcrR family transcriptional regulator